MTSATLHVKKPGRLLAQTPGVIPTPAKETKMGTTVEAAPDTVEAPSWATEVTPYVQDGPGGPRWRYLRNTATVLDKDVDLKVHIQECQATSDFGEAPIIVLTADTDEYLERRLTQIEARALAAALIDHAAQLDRIDGTPSPMSDADLGCIVRRDMPHLARTVEAAEVEAARG